METGQERQQPAKKGQKKRKRDAALLKERQNAIASGRAAAWGIRELAVSHGVSPGFVRNAIASRELRSVKVGPTHHHHESGRSGLA